MPNKNLDKGSCLDLWCCWLIGEINLEAKPLWKLIPLYLTRCIWREHNAWNFEDFERAVIELKAIVFNTRYVWAATYNCSCFSNFLEFLICVSLLPHDWCFFCILGLHPSAPFYDLCFSSASWLMFLLYTPRVHGLHPSTPFYEIELHIKKKKKNWN